MEIWIQGGIKFQLQIKITYREGVMSLRVPQSQNLDFPFKDYLLHK